MTSDERFERVFGAYLEAELDQHLAALRNTAEMLGYFRNALVDSGFSEQAAEDLSHLFASSVLHG